MVGSLVIDHYGLLGFASQPANTARLAGVSLVIAGMLVIARA
jgi:uncharacterized membrane protein YdcZ (DUF606 family)